jgi:hypothetical protein
LYYEVYDPGHLAELAASGNGKPGVHLLSNVSFFQGAAKAYESSLVEVSDLNARDRQAAVFQLDVPLNSLKPGFYICQLNVIDDASGHFLFPRFALLVRR